MEKWYSFISHPWHADRPSIGLFLCARCFCYCAITKNAHGEIGAGYETTIWSQCCSLAKIHIGIACPQFPQHNRQSAAGANSIIDQSGDGPPQQWNAASPTGPLPCLLSLLFIGKHPSIRVQLAPWVIYMGYIYL